MSSIFVGAQNRWAMHKGAYGCVDLEPRNLETMSIPTELRTALKTARVAAGLNQRDAGALFGVTNGAYNGWEIGKSIPAFDKDLLDKMTKFLGLTEQQMAALIVSSIVAWNARRANR